MKVWIRAPITNVILLLYKYTFFMQSTILLLYPCSTDIIKKSKVNDLGLFYAFGSKGGI